MSYDDLRAFADWSGLRPISELEFEKTCRGTLPPVAGEFAWGNTNNISATGIANSGLANETATLATANYSFNNAAGVQGPLRSGNFARAATNREQAGATYYGVMEMSGNLWEYCMSVGVQRAFDGTAHGNGSVTVAGASDVVGWPTSISIRGASFANLAPNGNVSDRANASGAYNSTRFNSTGIRLGRTAP